MAAPSAPKAAELYRSPQLLARAVTGLGSDCCVVTFSPFEHELRADRPGFGEQFFRQSSVDAVHVIPCGNHWYQYRDLPQACEAVATATRNYDRVVAYGSSMGAYAAIRYGGWAGAHLALALSPQFSIRRWKRPYDKRWLEAASDIYFLHEGNRSPVKRAIVAYDPHERMDAAHVRLFDRVTEVVHLPLADSGHPCTAALDDLKLLRQLVLDVASDRFSAAAVVEEFDRRSEDSPQVQLTRAGRAAAANERYDLALRASERWPDHVQTLFALASAAIDIGSPEVALAAVDRAALVEPRDSYGQYLRALAHEKAGRLDAATAILEELCRPETASPFQALAAARLKRR